MAQKRETFSELIEKHLPDDVFEPVNPKYQWRLKLRQERWKLREKRQRIDRLVFNAFAKAVRHLESVIVNEKKEKAG